MSQPLVTIGALNYNNGPFVLEALNSVREQTYSNLELIVVDDGSSDGSPELIREWLTSCPFPHLFVEHGRNQGIQQGYESILAQARGEFLTIFATDDRLLPDKTALQVKLLQDLGPDYGLVFGDVCEIDRTGNLLKASGFAGRREQEPHWEPPQGEAFAPLVESFSFYVQASLVRTEALRRPPFRFPERFLSEDYFFLLSLALRCKFAALEQVVTCYRILETSLTRRFHTDAHYHRWALSNFRMFAHLSGLPDQPESQRQALRRRMYGELLRYAYHRDAGYLESLRAWVHAVRSAGWRDSWPALLSLHRFAVGRRLRHEN